MPWTCPGRAELTIVLDAVLARPLGPIVIMAWLVYAFVPSHVVPLLKASRSVYTRRGPESGGLRHSHVSESRDRDGAPI